VVALGTIHVPVVPGGTIHSGPMPPDHARVMVDGIKDADFIDHPLPVPNDEQATLQDALGSFTAWPMSMISIGPDEVYYYYKFLYFLISIYMIELNLILYFISIYYKILQEPRKELGFPGGPNATSHCKAFDGINFDKLGRTFKQLRDRFLELDGSPLKIDPPLDLFGSTDPIDVYADDYAALLTPQEWLTVPVIQIWML
jgi:hypothetical protein